MMNYSYFLDSWRTKCILYELKLLRNAPGFNVLSARKQGDKLDGPTASSVLAWQEFWITLADR